MTPTQQKDRTQTKRDVPEQLDHNREQKGATHPASVVGNEIPGAKDDGPDHLSHNGEKDDQSYDIER